MRQRVDSSFVRARLAAQDGLGLVELVIALMVLSIGLLAIVAGFSSGMSALVRASQTSTAATLADGQMELYRGIRHTAIGLDAGSLPGDTVYQNDPALSGVSSQVTATCAGIPPECRPSQVVAGPDGHSYRIDTYIVWKQPTATARSVKQITIVVRNASDLSQSFTRQVSSFDELSG